ncbi:hypothetical protein G7Y79_00036g072150 [Physcia stellaris]|nr:hypothetical protein G7Y79_00036g072150 [Physcia stellaris]
MRKANPIIKFINSVLSSIGDKERAQPSQFEIESNGTTLNRESVIPDRDAEDVLPKAKEKILRTGPNGAQYSKAVPLRNPQRPSPTNQEFFDKPSLKTVPYRGTSRPSAQDGTISNKTPSKEVKRSGAAPIPSAQSIPIRDVAKTPGVTTATPTPEGTKVPKKGSYAEIMARAKAAANAPAIGVIKHQPKDKKAVSDKKELLLQKKGLTGKSKPDGKAAHGRHSSADISGGSRPSSSGKQEGPVKKKVQEIAYKGTAKPKPQPTYKGTMKPVPAATVPAQKKSFITQDDRSRSNSTSRPHPAKSRRRDYSEDDEDEEDEEDYESESDMEAGYSDVEEEETKATKIARKEDEFEARMEAEMKRQKEARKKREAEIARNQRSNNYE